MANGDDANTPPASQGWMSDVQRVIALLIIGLLVFASGALIVRLVISADINAVLDLAKIMLAAMVNMGLIALGFFFGNNQAKAVSDAGQQKIVDKLTSTQPPGPPGPVAPVSPTVVVAWWSKLTSAEQAAITAAASTDPKVASFMTAAQVGAATPDDLAYLVAKNPPLLTQDRATLIQTT